MASCVFQSTPAFGNQDYKENKYKKPREVRFGTMLFNPPTF